jgi:hypothetical protein
VDELETAALHEASDTAHDGPMPWTPAQLGERARLGDFLIHKVIGLKSAADKADTQRVTLSAFLCCVADGALPAAERWGIEATTTAMVKLNDDLGDAALDYRTTQDLATFVDRLGACALEMASRLHELDAILGRLGGLPGLRARVQTACSATTGAAAFEAVWGPPTNRFWDGRLPPEALDARLDSFVHALEAVRSHAMTIQATCASLGADTAWP